MSNAKTAILQVFTGLPDRVISASDIAKILDILDINNSTQRVTLRRLCESNQLVSVGRGQYKLGPANLALADYISKWDKVLADIRPWQPEDRWIIVAINDVPKQDRKLRQVSLRALQKFGFRSFGSDLYCRPANFVASDRQLQHRMEAIGLDPRAQWINGNIARSDLAGLWDVQTLQDNYSAMQDQVKALHQIDQKANYKHFLKTQYDVGHYCMKTMIADPVLPACFLPNPTLREEAFATAIDCTSQGFALWTEMIQGERPHGVN